MVQQTGQLYVTYKFIGFSCPTWRISWNSAFHKIAEKLGKDRAHELLYDKAMLAELDGKDYLTVLKEDPVLVENFKAQELEEMIKPENYTGLSAFLARRMAKEAKECAKRVKENQEHGIIQS